MEESSNILLTPTAKKNVKRKREYPFPIVNPGCKPGESDPSWKIAEGYLVDNFVLVHDDESIKRIYNMGFFGKGTLSKNAPRICCSEVKDPINKIQPEVVAEKPVACEEQGVDESVIEIIDSDEEDVNVKKESTDVEVVLSDSSSEDESSKKPKKSEEEVQKESLQLTFVEAYFLSYGLGCLVVKANDQMMNLSRLWIKFCELTKGAFPVMYTAYHHYRSKGWVVKCGLKFGADYVLYKDGPPFYHATYAVIVKSLKEQNLREVSGYRQFTWASLLALNRVNSTAGKGLLFLYVIRPQSMSEGKVSTPHCISQYKVEEVIFKRWVAAENREEEEGDTT